MKKGILTVLNIVVGAIVGGLVTERITSKKNKEIHKKVHELYMAFDQWLQIRQEGKTLAEYFTRNGYKTVAVYGMRELGERLCDELKDSDITVSYAIDKNADSIYSELNVVTPKEELVPVDVIVVTAITFFDEIEAELSGKVDCPVVSLIDVMYEVQTGED